MRIALLSVFVLTGQLYGCQPQSGHQQSADATRTAPVVDAAFMDSAHQSAPPMDMLLVQGPSVDAESLPESQQDATVVADAEVIEDAHTAPTPLCEDRCLESSITWGLTGGLMAFTVINSLSPCRQQEMSVETFFAEDPDDRRCERLVDQCPEPNAELFASVVTLLETPSVLNAFENAAFFGVDSRPYDGPILSIRYQDRELLIGEPCPTNDADCQEPPADLSALVDALETLRRSMSETVDCIGITDEL